MAFLCLLAVFWVGYVGPIVGDGLRGFDIYRDVAYAKNFQHGRLFSDPSYAGETIWYPPLSPAVIGALGGVLPKFGKLCGLALQRGIGAGPNQGLDL